MSLRTWRLRATCTNAHSAPAQELNLTIDQFIEQLLIQPCPRHQHLFPPSLPVPPRLGFALLDWTPPQRILRPTNPSDFYDIQQIPWWEIMRVKRSLVRLLRDSCYTSYHNLELSPTVILHTHTHTHSLTHTNTIHIHFGGSFCC